MDTEKEADKRDKDPEIEVRDLTPEKDAKGGGSASGGPKLGDSTQPIPRDAD